MPSTQRRRDRDFSRPELITPWQRIAGNKVLQVTVFALLAVSTVVLVVIASQQY